MPTEELIERLADFFAGNCGDGVQAAYLFGSHAEERAHRESDVDVAVLLDRKRWPTAQERFEVRVALTSELIGALHHNEVDLVVLNDLPPLLARRILREGRSVYSSDREAEIRCLRDVQLRAADLEPWLRRMRRIKLEALSG